MNLAILENEAPVRNKATDIHFSFYLSSIPCGNSPGGGIPGGSPGGPPIGIRPRPLPRMPTAPGRPGNPEK